MLLPVAAALRAQSDGDFDHGLMAYSKTAPTDSVARLQRRVDSGEISRVRTAPGVSPSDSPSAERAHILTKPRLFEDQLSVHTDHPWPSALYFNDDVYVGHKQWMLKKREEVLLPGFLS
jgi:hypothetical protein